MSSHTSQHGAKVDEQMCAFDLCFFIPCIRREPSQKAFCSPNRNFAQRNGLLGNPFVDLYRKLPSSLPLKPLCQHESQRGEGTFLP